MEAVIFCGIQGSGKSTFYQQRFFATHVRLNLDMLRTRRRERILLQACLHAGQRFVVDNTNATRAQRAVYIAAAKAAHFRIIGYFFETSVPDALERNRLRTGKQRIPDQGIYAMANRLERPTLDEGFDELHTVRIIPGGGFEVLDQSPA